MHPRTKRRISRVIKTVIVLYLIGGVILYFCQGLLLFHPAALPKDHKFSFDQPFEELNLPFEKENLNIVKFKPARARKGIVLFFHGNMNNVEHYKKYPALFTRNDFEIWMIDYPGFGKSTGKPTENVMYEQATLMYELAAQQMHSDSIIIYGKSLGTAVASYLASTKDCKMLVLETPYASIEALAHHYFTIYSFIPLSKYSFPNDVYLKNIKRPVTIFHGTSDKVVPYKQGKQLAEENKAELVTIENGTHNDLFGFALYQKKMDSLLVSQ